MERPSLNEELDSEVFLLTYYLKEELLAFCKKTGLPAAGGKQELTDRIAHYLRTGQILQNTSMKKKKSSAYSRDTVIVENLSCNEELRAFFKAEIGDQFTFNVPFQEWLKEHAGKTYADAIEAYKELKRNKAPRSIRKQFEYNTYIRDFFQDNPSLSLREAILCWNFKKRNIGSHRYERRDLEALGMQQT